MFIEVFGHYALLRASRKKWFQQFRINDFGVRNDDDHQKSLKQVQVMLDEDGTLTQKQIAKILIFAVYWKNPKVHKLVARQIENQNTRVKFCCKDLKKNLFSMESLLAMKNGT